MSRTNEVEQACRRGASMRGSIADAATLAAEVALLAEQNARLRAALTVIASFDTGQSASPDLCSAVCHATIALADGGEGAP